MTLLPKSHLDWSCQDWQLTKIRRANQLAKVSKGKCFHDRDSKVFEYSLYLHLSATQKLGNQGCHLKAPE